MGVSANHAVHILIWVYPGSGFSRSPAHLLAALLTSLFTDEYCLAIDLLVEARRAAKLTQQELASRLGRPQSFVSKYERRERRLDVVEYIHVARCIGADVAQATAEIERMIITAPERPEPG